MPQLTIEFRDARHDAERVALALCMGMEGIRSEHVLGDLVHPKTAPMCKARMILCYILARHMGHPHGSIGEAIGKDRTSILRAVTNAEAQVPLYLDMHRTYVATCHLLDIRPHKRLRWKAPLVITTQPKRRDAGPSVIPMRWEPNQRRAKRPSREVVRLSIAI